MRTNGENSSEQIQQKNWRTFSQGHISQLPDWLIHQSAENSGRLVWLRQALPILAVIPGHQAGKDGHHHFLFQFHNIFRQCIHFRSHFSCYSYGISRICQLVLYKTEKIKKKINTWKYKLLCSFIHQKLCWLATGNHTFYFVWI